MTNADLPTLLDQADAVVAERLERLLSDVDAALWAHKAQRPFITKAIDPLLKRELSLQEKIQAVLNEYAGKIAKLIGQGQSIKRSFYNEMSDDLYDTLIGELSATYIETALDTQKAIDSAVAISVDWTAPNTQAQNWVRQYTFDLVRGLDDTTQAQVQANITALQQDIAGFFEKPMKLSDLRGKIGKYIPDWQDRLGRVWSSAERAEMIASTEVTRASVQGELDQANYLKDNYGIEMVSIWQTSRDEIVCPICAPRHNKRQGNGWDDPPPAHPRCRCAISLELKR